MAGWGDFFGKIGQQFQSRTERLKNEKASLLDERHKIFRSNVTAVSSSRVIAIDTRVQQINEALGNAVTG